MGRPSSYTPELGERVCKLIASSEHGMRKALRLAREGIPEEGIAGDKSYPEYTTVLEWADKWPDFATSLAQARATRLKGWVEDMIDIADDDTLDPAVIRVRVDARRWIISKEAHRIYGDKLDVTSGGEALPPPSHQIDARIQSIIMQAQQRRLAGGQEVDAVALDVSDEAKKLLG